MKNVISHIDHLLPHWLEKLQIQWVQWIYAMWQIVRCNPLTLLLLSYLPFLLWRVYNKRKTMVALGSTKEFDMSYEEERDYLANHPLTNLEVISRTQIPETEYYYCMVKHRGYYYITREDALCELTKCSHLFGENIIFVERVLYITRGLAVGKMLSQTEAYERILSGRYHCSRGADFIVPIWIDYVDLNSKLWGVLSTIPILLQAKNYVKLSGLLSLLIILLDLNRKWLYKIYDKFLNRFAQYVKINIFKERTDLYNFFSIFNKRFKYSDTVKKYAYVTKPGYKATLLCYSKLESDHDLEIVGWDHNSDDGSEKRIFMQIDRNEAYYSFMAWDVYYPVAVLHKPVYVR